MPLFQLKPGVGARRWPRLGIRLAPGDTVERDVNPDPRFLEPVGAPAPAAPTAKAAAAAQAKADADAELAAAQAAEADADAGLTAAEDPAAPATTDPAPTQE